MTLFFQQYESMAKKMLTIVFVWTNISATYAQKIKREDYFAIDTFVQRCGPMEGMRLGFITDSITRQCHTELEMTRAFYRWETLFVEFDTRRVRRPGNFPDNAASALNERKAASEGYARMFKAMCDLKSISCEVVHGLIRRDERDIGELNTEAWHYWNIITINNTRFVVDVSLGVGEMDRKRKFFYRKYTDAWWLSNRKIFLLSHFPDRPEMQLQNIPIKKQQFSKGPIASTGALTSGLMANGDGTLKGIEDSALILKHTFSSKVSLPGVYVSYDDEPRKEAVFDLDNYGVYLTLRFPKAGEYLIKVYVSTADDVSGSLAYTYKAQVKKRKGKKR